MWCLHNGFLRQKSDSTVERLKAQLVARGFSQVPGIDFLETFSLVIKPATIHIVLTFALSHNWEIHQLDVKNTFLHGLLNQTVFTEQPPGFISSNHPNHVCQFHRALYGMCHAPTSMVGSLWNIFAIKRTFLYHLRFIIIHLQ